MTIHLSVFGVCIAPFLPRSSSSWEARTCIFIILVWILVLDYYFEPNEENPGPFLVWGAHTAALEWQCVSKYGFWITNITVIFKIPISKLTWQGRYHDYKMVFTEWALFIALWMCWPLWFLQMGETQLHNLQYWGTAFAVFPKKIN